MNNSQVPVARKSGLVVQEVPGELLVYDLDTNKAHCLNTSAALIWKSCDGKNSVSDIARLVENESSDAVGEDFVWLAIDQLSESNLLEREMAPKFAGSSRRDAIKKIGLATMVGLPIIASLVAPKSALAGSSCLCGQVSDCRPPLSTTCPTGFCVNGACTNTAPPPSISVDKTSGSKKSR